MRATLVPAANLFLLVTMLAAAGFGSAPVASKDWFKAPDLGDPPSSWVRSEARWRWVSQAGSSATKERGETIYQGFCIACHGATRAGVPSVFPSLIDISKRQSDAEIASQIRHGKGRMLAFPDLSDDDIKALLVFLKTPPDPNPSKPLGMDPTHWTKLATTQSVYLAGVGN